jgi:hypothetical protein
MEHILTLEVPEKVYTLLKQNAEQAGQLPEILAAQLLTTAAQNLANDPLEEFIGAFSSQDAD